MKKYFKIILLTFIFLLFIYLILPPPSELPPLPGALKSDEPGDTVQIPGISAYYSNLTRQEVVNFYQTNFSKSRFMEIPLLTYRLNHPPEYIKEAIGRSTQQASYLEEIVHPFRESLFVSGFEWQNDPFTKPEKRPINKMFIKGNDYSVKVTLVTRQSNPIVRIIIVLLSLIVIVWITKEILNLLDDIKKSFRKNKTLR